MENATPIALFDLDGTLADYHGRMEQDLEAMRAPGEEPLKFLYDDSEHPLPSYIEARKLAITRQEGWWRNLPILDLGWDIFMEALEADFRLEILTKGPINKSLAWKEKVEWCAKNISYEHGITITRDKGMVYGKVLVDDYPSYILDWLKWRPRGLVIMPAHNYNEYFHHPNVIRYTGDHMRGNIARALHRAFIRKRHETVDWKEFVK